MSFSQATIVSVNPPVYTGFQVSLSWADSTPATGMGSGGFGSGLFGSASGGGVSFQVYIDRRLAWWGKTKSARIAIGGAGPVRVDIGTVLPGEEQLDFSGDLPTVANRRARLSWLGGLFQAADIAGFRVYGGSASGGFGVEPFDSDPFGDVELTTLLADITAYPGGIMTDGYGFGTFGGGTFGSAASSYAWTSDPLTRGNWTFAVVPYDSNGNLGDPTTAGVTIVCPPLPPALDDDGARMTYTYDDGTQTAVLNWLASPG